jgi:hypothetical protein
LLALALTFWWWLVAVGVVKAKLELVILPEVAVQADIELPQELQVVVHQRKPH